MWDELLFVNVHLGFMALEKVMLAFEFEVIEKIPLVQVIGFYLVIFFTNLLLPILSWWEFW